MNNRWMKGPYYPKNPEKYKGDPTKIMLRSSWERTFATWCDMDADVVAWSSETVIIPYFDPVKGQERSYHVDFRVVVKTPEGPKVRLVEIKPYKQTQKPRPNRNKSDKTILSEATTWMTNEAKWKAARTFCKALNWEFHIITERDLFGDIDKSQPTVRQGRQKKAAKG